MSRFRTGVLLTALTALTASTALWAQAPVDTTRAALHFTQADVDFLSGMIAHHAQAIAMARWAPTHGAGPAVQRLCERIVNAQTDEITIMSNWLRDRHQPVPPPDPRGLAMPGMSGQPMLMPGMLTPAQMARLDSARGPEFDRVFLRGMIQHHQGAVDMVNALFARGSGEEETVYKLASDIYADQTTEIARMQQMLLVLLNGGD